jgi:hypothetical protein
VWWRANPDALLNPHFLYNSDISKDFTVVDLTEPVLSTIIIEGISIISVEIFLYCFERSL